MEAIAEDRGSQVLSRTVEVQIDVVDRSNKPPVWDQAIYGPIYVKENEAVGATVTTIKARSVGCSNGVIATHVFQLVPSSFLTTACAEVFHLKCVRCDGKTKYS